MAAAGRMMGAHGGGRGLHEKVIALQVAQKTKERLEAQGATVILTATPTRTSRWPTACASPTRAGADVFLSSTATRWRSARTAR